MKNGKNPTLKQKQAMNNMGLNASNWLVSKVDTKKNQLQLVHRLTGTIKTIPA